MLLRVESIFDIGVSKLWSDNLDVNFVSPNKKLRDALGLKENSDPHDVHISDLDQRAGILLKGAAPAVTELVDLISAQLPSVVVFRHPIQQDAVYLAVVVKYIYRKKLAVLDLDGRSRGILFNTRCEEGDQLLVQVKELTTESDKLPVCSTSVSLTGNYVILEAGASFVRVSRKIKGNARKQLHQLGKKVVPDNFGIIIRTSAVDISEDKLESEINQLVELWNRTEDDARENDHPTRLISGDLLVEILFTNDTKAKLDEIRESVLPTVTNYYQFKAYSMASGFTFDFLQKYLDTLPKDEITNHMRETVRERDYPINNHLKIEFKYLDGTRDEIVLGDLFENQEVFKTRKEFDYKPKDNFPNFEVNEGDILEVTFALGSWSIYYKYISGKTNEIIGERVQIVLPLDLAYRGRIRAIDMGMNLYKNSGSDSSVVHQAIDKSRTGLVERGIISEQLDQSLGEVLQQILEGLNESAETILVLDPSAN